MAGSVCRESRPVVGSVEFEDQAEGIIDGDGFVVAYVADEIAEASTTHLERYFGPAGDTR